MNRCTECGAEYGDEGETCGSRFDQLLALDHSRQEPWGSRHGLAFAAFALQHPTRFSREVEQGARELLSRVYDRGEAMTFVVNEMRRRRDRGELVPLPREGDAPTRVARAQQYAVTIATLGDFDARSYPERLDAWCRSALRTSV
jgi:hypothetical protein